MGPNDANVGLGFQISPSGIQTHTIASQHKQSDALAAKLNTAHLTDCETWVLFESIYCIKVFYPCKVTLFLEKDWTNVTRQTVCAFSSKMGFNRNTSLKLLHGPRALGDTGLTHRFSKQGVDCTCHLLTHLCWNKEVGTLIKCVLSQLHLLSGRRTVLLESSALLSKHHLRKGSHIYAYHHLGNGWLVCIRNFLYEINGKITMPSLWKPKPFCLYKDVLMDIFNAVMTLSK